MPENSALQFVDTNIIVYAYDVSHAEKWNRARSLLEDLWKSGHGCISIQVLQELFVTLTRKIPKPIPVDTATRLIGDLGQWRLHTPGLESILEAVDIQQRNHLSFWDAMIVCSAKSMGCQTIWTEDLNANQVYENVKAVNPFL
ncbi:MAG TPA: PIN domain-containing protein [Firmicutes bacterium]|jgi:predicted nucleic acid-binding protein|nr:PIN domain-containing protein [Bacillota bacterium]